MWSPGSLSGCQQGGWEGRSAKLKDSSCQPSPATHCPRPMWQTWLQGASFQIGGAGSGRPVDEGQAGDEDEGHPPPPDNEEVVLVEHIVGEKTENVLLVGISPNSTSLHTAGDLSGKKVAHGVGWAC